VSIVEDCREEQAVKLLFLHVHFPEKQLYEILIPLLPCKNLHIVLIKRHYFFDTSFYSLPMHDCLQALQTRIAEISYLYSL